MNWKTLYRIGGTVAAIAVGALLFDIVLSMLPGWNTETTPVTVQGWFAQFDGNTWLALRNLDLLNVCVSVLSLPLYVAIAVALRKTRAPLAYVGLALVATGTVLFAASNAALPMLELAQQRSMGTMAERAAIESAAVALLARGAHGSAGAFPGFFLSEVGTLVVAAAMLGRTGVFGRRTGLLGVVGAASLVVYSAIMTFAAVPAELVVAIAAPGGLMMIAWHVLVARRLFALAKGEAEAAVAADVVSAEVSPA